MAMNGIGNFQEKLTRIKVQQEMADKYNRKYDELESQGLDLEEIPQIIQIEEIQLKATMRQTKTLPFDMHTEVIGVGNNLVQGYNEAHKGMSTTKQMYQKADQKYNLMQSKKQGLLNEEQLRQLEQAQLESYVKNQDKEMKEEIYKDHIMDLMNAKEKATKSNYQANYLFTKEMQEECDNQNFDFHQRKNDLKQYTEAYAKCKTTMRK